MQGNQGVRVIYLQDVVRDLAGKTGFVLMHKVEPQWILGVVHEERASFKEKFAERKEVDVGIRDPSGVVKGNLV